MLGLVQIFFDASPVDGLIIFFVVGIYLRVYRKEKVNG
jgi:hypothetical protein